MCSCVSCASCPRVPHAVHSRVDDGKPTAPNFYFLSALPPSADTKKFVAPRETNFKDNHSLAQRTACSRILTAMTPSTRRGCTCQRKRARASYSRGVSAMTCLAFLASTEGFFTPSLRMMSSLMAPSQATATLNPVQTEPFFSPQDSAGPQCDQDFRGLFPPVHRPLSFRDDVSEANRGLWVFEQVRVTCARCLCLNLALCVRYGPRTTVSSPLSSHVVTLDGLMHLPLLPQPEQVG